MDGTALLNTNHYAFMGQLFLYAGPKPGSATSTEGMLFDDRVTTPNVSLYGGAGTWYHLQLISVNRNEFKVGSATAIPALGNGVTNALDYGTSYIYDGSFIANGTDLSTTGNIDNDWPCLKVDNIYGEYQVSNESFQTWIMYHPPGALSSTIDVPLSVFTWQWNADVHIPQSAPPQSWANLGNQSVGSVSHTTASRMTVYPTWSALRNLNWAPN